MKQSPASRRKFLSVLLLLIMVMQVLPIATLADDSVSWNVPELTAVVGETFDMLAGVTATAEDDSALTVIISEVTAADADYAWNDTDNTFTPEQAGEYVIVYSALSAEDGAVLDTYERTVTVAEKAGSENLTEDSAIESEPELSPAIVDSLLPDSVIDVVTLDGDTGTDVTSSVTFFDPVLTSGSTNDTTYIEGEGNVFKYSSYYRFSVSWSATGPFSDGDYFTFTVPSIFGNRSIDIIMGGVTVGKITITSAGAATATFNSNISEYQELSGSMLLFGSYTETVANKEVTFTFSFGNQVFVYKGTSNGYTTTLTKDSYFVVKTYKVGDYSSTYYNYYWYIFVNMPTGVPLLNMNGKVTVTDTIGAGHQIIPYPTAAASIDSPGYYGVDGVPYFLIRIIDWDLMRTDYNAIYNSLPEDDKTYGSYTLIECADGRVTSYMRGTMLTATYMAGDTIPEGKAVGDYKYLSLYTGEATCTLTDDGFTIVFPEGVSTDSLRIVYYTELTSAVPVTTISNNAAVKYDETTTSYTASTSIRGSAVVTGTKGKLLLYKQDTGEKELFKDVTFTLEKNDKSYSSTLTTGQGGSLTFTLTAPYAGTYTLTEDPNTTPAGYHCADPITLELNSDGEIIAVNGVSTTGKLTFDSVCRLGDDLLVLIVYNKKLAPVDVTLSATKTLTGRDLEAGEFSFTLTETTAGSTYTQTVRNLAGGTFAFDAITYTKAGTYTYTVSEVVPATTPLGGVTYDGTVYTVTVTVTDNGNGTLTATPTYKIGDNPADAIVFANDYAASGSLTLSGTKKLTGRDLTAGEFSFTLTETTTSESTYTDTVSNLSGGSFAFKPITYTAAGTYTYTVSEAVPTTQLGGVTYDSTAYMVTVTVSDNGDGTLTATPTYKIGDNPATAIQFANTYTASGSLTLSGTKELDGRDLEVEEFSFTLTETTAPESTYTQTVTNDADGNIVFSAINYAKAGTYTYTVSEVVPTTPLGGVTYDGTVYMVTVNVVENGNGTLTATPTYKIGDETATAIQFNNRYAGSFAADESVTLGGTKQLDGRDLAAGEFSFILTETTAVSTYTETVSNLADGSFKFSDITYAEAGTYTYTVSEVVPATKLGGVTYDTTVYTVTVTVTDDLLGNLDATVVYKIGDETADAIQFANDYAASGSLTLEGTKELDGRDLQAEEFSFTLTETTTSESTYTQTVTNDADGNIAFTPIAYTEAGTYTYTVSEVVPATKLGGITYDTTVYTVTVNVVDNKDGTLTATAAYPSGVIVFNNSYTPGSTSIALAGTKTLTGRDTKLEADEFSFVVKDDEDQTVLSTKNSADGTITFGTLTFDAVGEYTYTISEVAGDDTSITYDSTVYTVIVAVTDNKGVLETEVTYLAGDEEADTVTFHNVYKNSAEPSRTVLKVWDDNDDQAGKRPESIEVQLYADGEAYEAAVTLNEANNWTYTWSNLPEAQDGTAVVYTVEEVSVPADYTASYSSDGFAITNKYVSSDSNTPTDSPTPQTPTASPVPQTPTSPAIPKTGDSSFPIGLIVLALISSAGGIALLLKKRKSSNA